MSRISELPEVRLTVSEYLKGCDIPFTSRTLQSHILKTLGIIVPMHCIRNLLKKVYNLSYKRGNKRPLELDSMKLWLWKQLFCVRVATNMDNLKMLISVDETSINRSTCTNYSWLERGRSWALKNIKLKQSINTISWITTLGTSMHMVKSSTSRSNHFIIFLDNMLKHNRQNFDIDKEDIAIILDNWSIYRAKAVREYWKQNDIKVYFLPAYSPELSPIEMYFSRFKNLLIEYAGNNSLDLRSEKAIKIITKWTKKIDWNFVKKLWTKLLEMMKDHIKEIAY